MQPQNTMSKMACATAKNSIHCVTSHEGLHEKCDNCCLNCVSLEVKFQEKSLELKSAYKIIKVLQEEIN